jgi:hypothetical protein
MTFRGSVRGGVVVFDDAVPLREGTVVEVAPVAEPARHGSGDALLRAEIRWSGPPEEVDVLLDQVQQMREADVTRPGENGA